jgi:hypothetical protein
MPELGRTLVVLGTLLVLVGAVLLIAPRIPWLGRLPGDILIRREHVTVYVPVVTCLVLSAVLTLLLNLFWRR